MKSASASTAAGAAATALNMEPRPDALAVLNSVIVIAFPEDLCYYRTAAGR